MEYAPELWKLLLHDLFHSRVLKAYRIYQALPALGYPGERVAVAGLPGGPL